VRELWFKQPLESLDAAQREAYEDRRDRALAAAERLMSKRGLEVPMAQIATEAGLGMSSLYRTYASKDELIADVASRRAGRWLEIWSAAADRDDDPGVALEDAVWELMEGEAANPGLAEVLRHYALSHRGEFAAIERAGGIVVDRASAAGAIRGDATYEDVVSVFRMIPALYPDGDHSWRRGLKLFLDGLFATDTGPLPDADWFGDPGPAESA
jgi:AcrR family transcriptional regulator